jgi:hypothetical protein
MEDDALWKEIGGREWRKEEGFEKGGTPLKDSGKSPGND